MNWNNHNVWIAFFLFFPTLQFGDCVWSLERKYLCDAFIETDNKMKDEKRAHVCVLTPLCVCLLRKATLECVIPSAQESKPTATFIKFIIPFLSVFQIHWSCLARWTLCSNLADRITSDSRTPHMSFVILQLDCVSDSSNSISKSVWCIECVKRHLAGAAYCGECHAQSQCSNNFVISKVNRRRLRGTSNLPMGMCSAWKHNSL